MAQEGTSNSRRPEKVVHPCLLRLTGSSGITVNSPQSLASAGYASVAMGLFTLFRITPFLLFWLTYNFRIVNSSIAFSKALMFVLLFTWSGFVLFVLFVFGLVLVMSGKITKRSVLLLHPWGLLLLYLDVFVWISLILYLHFQMLKHPELSRQMFSAVYHPLVYFIVMYVETIVFVHFNLLNETFLWLTLRLTAGGEPKLMNQLK